MHVPRGDGRETRVIWKLRADGRRRDANLRIPELSVGVRAPGPGVTAGIDGEAVGAACGNGGSRRIGRKQNLTGAVAIDLGLVTELARLISPPGPHATGAVDCQTVRSTGGNGNNARVWGKVNDFLRCIESVDETTEP